MDARAYGKAAGLALWPAFACLSAWLALGGMPAAVESVFLAVLWAMAVILLAGVLGAAVLLTRTPPSGQTAPAPGRLGRITFYVLPPCQLAVILALFLADKPILGACLLLGFLGLWALKAYSRRRRALPSD